MLRLLHAARSDLLEQRSDPNTTGLDHDKIPGELVRMRGNNIVHRVGLRRVGQPIQFQQHDPAGTEALANDHFAEITVLRD